MLDLIGAGRQIRYVATNFEISEQAIYSWRRQDRVDRVLEPGLSSVEHAELVAACRHICELETELAVHRLATELLRTCQEFCLRACRKG